MPASNDLAACKPGGDEGITGRCAPELDGKVVHLVEDFGDLAGLGEKLSSEGAAFADCIDGGGNDFLVIVSFLFELGDGCRSNALCGGCGSRVAGRKHSGIGGKQAGLVEEDFVAEATPAADREVIFSGSGKVVVVLAIVDDGASDLISFVFEFLFLPAFVLGVTDDCSGLEAGESDEGFDFLAGSSGFFAEFQRSLGFPDGDVDRVVEDGEADAEGFDSVGNGVVHAMECTIG